MPMEMKNYVIGRGKVFFDKFTEGTQTKTGERYIGNTPTLTTTGTYQDLPHYNSDEGIREQDDNVTLQVDRNGSFSCDNVNMENVGIMFGSADPFTDVVGSSSGESEVFSAVKLGYFYQLGASDDIPDGVGNVSSVVVTNNTGLHAFATVTFAAAPAAADSVTINGHAITFRASAPGAHEVLIGANASASAANLIAEIAANPTLYLVNASGAATVVTLRAIASGTGGNAITLVKSGTNIAVSGATLAGGSASGVIGATGNYNIDLVNGRIQIIETAPDISAGDNIEVQYNIGASSRITVIDDNTAVEGALRFIADNPKGSNKNYYWPRVKLTPSGDYALKADTWQTMTFNFAVLEPAAGNRVYIRQA